MSSQGPRATPMVTPYTELLVRHLVEAGHPRDALLAGTDIALTDVAEPGRPIRFEQHQRVVRNALALTGNPGLGLWFGKQLKLASLGLVGYGAMSSRTLSEAALLIARFHALRVPNLELKIEPPPVADPRAAPSLRLEETRDYGDIRVFSIESVLQSVSELSTMLLGHAPATLSFDVAYARPAHWDDAAFAHPVRFGQDHHRIHIGASALAAPLPNADPGAASAIAALLQAQLDARASSGPLQQRVRRVLAASFRRDEREFPDAARVAEQLGCSPRTLRRDLMAQGTSYRELADEVRCRLAIEALRSRELTVAQVGERLGYRDTANFRRAFKRWTGRVPADYREG
ncbi:MAG: AraC family transcriptional regulator [Polyangiales bacterium]|nr:AraC family transcriptional regulator [Sandaracinaceae bacterium]